MGGGSIKYLKMGHKMHHLLLFSPQVLTISIITLLYIYMNQWGPRDGPYRNRSHVTRDKQSHVT